MMITDNTDNGSKGLLNITIVQLADAFFLPP